MFVIFLVLCVQIIKTPILGFWPYINQHDIVILDEYAIDFTPLKKQPWDLLLGKNVKGRVRLRHVTKLDNSESQIFIKNNKIKKIVKKLFEWDPTMNLYTHNCQHFSSYAKKVISETQ
jgi:hypothetical protein